MTIVIEIPGIVGNITEYRDTNNCIVISNITNVDIKVNGKLLKSHETKTYD